jgi:hypothetical protein
MMYTPQRKVPQSLRALAREKGKVVTCLPLPALEEGKVQPPPMIPEEAIHAKALEVISGGGGEVVPSDGDIWRHFHPKVHWICPHWSKKIRLHCKLRYQLWNLSYMATSSTWAYCCSNARSGRSRWMSRSLQSLNHKRCCSSRKLHTCLSLQNLRNVRRLQRKPLIQNDSVWLI